MTLQVFNRHGRGQLYSNYNVTDIYTSLNNEEVISVVESRLHNNKIDCLTNYALDNFGTAGYILLKLIDDYGVVDNELMAEFNDVQVLVTFDEAIDDELLDTYYADAIAGKLKR